MSIEALAMAGADYMEFFAHTEIWTNDSIEQIPEYLLADEEISQIQAWFRGTDFPGTNAEQTEAKSRKNTEKLPVAVAGENEVDNGSNNGFR